MGPTTSQAPPAAASQPPKLATTRLALTISSRPPSAAAAPGSTSKTPRSVVQCHDVFGARREREVEVRPDERDERRPRSQQDQQQSAERAAAAGHAHPAGANVRLADPWSWRPPLPRRICPISTTYLPAGARLPITAAVGDRTYAAVVTLFESDPVAGRPGGRRPVGAAGRADAPAHAGRGRGAGTPAGGGLAAAPAGRGRRADVADPVRAAGHRQDHAGAHRLQRHQPPLRAAVRAERRGEGRPRGDRAGQGRAHPRRAARPSCSSTRSTASPRPSRTRCWPRSRPGTSRWSPRPPRTRSSPSSRRCSRAACC